jgi:hypothetical protein
MTSPFGKKYSCGAPVVFKQASDREKQSMAFSLMGSFTVIVPSILGQHPQQWTLTEQNRFE